MTEPSHDDALEASDLAAHAEALERRIAELEVRTTARLVQAELRAEAKLAGIIDLDGLKLADPTPVSVTAEGEVRGANTVIRELKRAKPWLFGGASTSSTASVPPTQKLAARSARELSHDEWQAARAELIKRR